MTDDVIIAGGGLAGALCAIHLVSAGMRVTILERSSGPHDKVCGEFLSGEALFELRAIGVEPKALGAIPLSAVRMAATGSLSEARLPFEALSLSRRVLDEVLLRKAADLGVIVKRGMAVRSVASHLVTLASGETRNAERVVLATGKYDVRGWKRSPGIHDQMVGIKTYLQAERDIQHDLQGKVDIVFFPGGYCGFQEVEGQRINMCLAADSSLLKQCGGTEELFEHMNRHAPYVRCILNGSNNYLAQPVAVGRVPYGFVQRDADGFYRVGDQAAVIPSFCGEGMGLALRSGRLAAEAMIAGETADVFQNRFARLAAPRVRAASKLSRLMAKPLPQRAAVQLAALAPAVLTYLAAATRTPQSRIRRIPNQRVRQSIGEQHCGSAS
jgi:flavin-dependent dehydrogenase